MRSTRANRPAELKKERHQYVRSSGEPKEHAHQQERNDEKKRKSKSNSRQTNKKTCEKPKAEREEHMKHTEDLHIQHQVNEDYTKITLKNDNRRNRTSP